MFLHLCRKRSSTWGHMDHSWKKPRWGPRFHTGHCQHCSVIDEMTFTMYRNPKNMSKVERDLPQNRADKRQLESRKASEQPTLSCQFNHFTFWYEIVQSRLYVFVRSAYAPLMVRFNFHAYFFSKKKKSYFSVLIASYKLPPCKIVTFSHEIELEHPLHFSCQSAHEYIMKNWFGATGTL